MGGSYLFNIYFGYEKKNNVLRRLKYLLNREHLLKIYKSFILPVLEYACELWDGCTTYETELLEKAQREASRIITGLPSYARIEDLLFETGLETLSNRRKRRKIQLLYKMHNKLTPEYLNNLLPSTVADNTRYALRNNSDYRIPPFRLSLTNSSFIPSTLRHWNSLDLPLRSLTSLYSFKNSLTSNVPSSPPLYFSFGEHKINILHTKLRHQCSSLKYDLFRVNLVDSPVCYCGHPCENAFHFFCECIIFNNERSILLQNLNILHVDFTLPLLLFGNPQLSTELNTNIFRHVHHYIKSSKRF